MFVITVNNKAMSKYLPLGAEAEINAPYNSYIVCEDCGRLFYSYNEDIVCPKCQYYADYEDEYNINWN